MTKMPKLLLKKVISAMRTTGPASWRGSRAGALAYAFPYPVFSPVVLAGQLVYCLAVIYVFLQDDAVRPHTPRTVLELSPAGQAHVPLPLFLIKAFLFCIP